MYINTVFKSISRIIKRIINIFNHIVYDSKSGELIVSGKHSVNISLKYFPNKVSVHFTGDQITTPCNPYCDKLTYEINCIKKSHSYVLNIKWDVSNTRIIKWYVEY